MKKALAIISAIALVGVAAFAEDAATLKLSGALETGIKSTFGDGSDKVEMWDDDSGTSGRFDINGNYTNGNGGVAFKLREQTTSASVLAEAPVVNFAQGWVDLFDNKATVMAGLLDNNAWKTDADSDYTSENGTGIQVQIKPVAGLNVGVKFNAPGTADAVVTYTPKQFFNEIGLGGRYATDTLAIAAGYKMDSDADAFSGAYGYTAAELSALGIDVDAEKEGMFYAGINYFGITNLKIQTEAKFENLGAYSDVGLMTANEIVQYQVSDPLDVGIVMYQWQGGNSDLDSQTVLQFKPYVDYKVNAITTASAEVGYKLNEGFVQNVNNLWLKPSAVFQVTPSTSIHTWYEYDLNDIGDETTDGKTTVSKFFVGLRCNF
jgi:hypothetical protein